MGHDMRFLFITCFLLLTINANSAEWVEIPLDEDEYKVYIDTRTAVVDKPFIEFWLKIEQKELKKIPGSDMKFSKILLHFLISCEDRAEALDQEKYFREGVLVKSIRIEPEELTWKPVEPDTTNDLLMNKYCTDKTKPEEKQQ